MEPFNKFTILVIFAIVFVAIYCNPLRPESEETDLEAAERPARRVIPNEEAGNKTLKELNEDFFLVRERFMNGSLAGNATNETNPEPPAEGGEGAGGEAGDGGEAAPPADPPAE